MDRAHLFSLFFFFVRYTFFYLYNRLLSLLYFFMLLYIYIYYFVNPPQTIKQRKNKALSLSIKNGWFHVTIYHTYTNATLFHRPQILL